MTAPDHRPYLLANNCNRKPSMSDEEIRAWAHGGPRLLVELRELRAITRDLVAAHNAGQDTRPLLDTLTMMVGP